MVRGCRTQQSRAVRLDTWDRTAIPLPFNEIRYYYRGPFEPPPDPADRAAMHAYHLQVEDALIDLAAQSYDDFGQARPASLVNRSAKERAELAAGDER